MLDLNYIYKSKYKILKKKNRKFKSFKNVILLKDFKKKYLKPWYSPRQTNRLRRFLNIGPYLMNKALIKRSLLHKFLTFKYRAIYFPLKVLPRRFRKYKRKSTYLKKKRKKKLNLRIRHFFQINYDNLLFYLTIFDKKIIIKPFNFLSSLFFYKTKYFKKIYKIQIRQRVRFNYAKFRKFKFRRFVKKRRRLKRLRRFRLKKKMLIKRFFKLKIGSFFNFFRFIAFLHICKKINLTNDDLFKIKSIAILPYNLLKFNLNKLTNSYNFFFNFKRNNKKKLYKIKFYTNSKTIEHNEKSKLYKIIKSKLKNRKKFKNTVNLSIFNYNSTLTEFKTAINGYHILYFLIQKLLCEYKLLHIINNNNLNLTFTSFNKFKEFKHNINTNIFNVKININYLLKLNKSIRKIFKKLIYFDKIFTNLKTKRKNKLSNLFVKNLKKPIINKTKILNNYKNKYKKVLDNVFYIINTLQLKFEKLFLNFNILFLIYKKNKQNTTNSLKLFDLTNNRLYLKKIKNQLKIKNQDQLKMKKKLNLFLFSLKFNKKKIYYFSRPSKIFEFSYKTKFNNKNSHAEFGWFRQKRLKNKRMSKFHLRELKPLKRTFNLKNVIFYKNISENSYLCKQKLQYLSINILKQTNLKNSKTKQLTKNLNFLNVN